MAQSLQAIDRLVLSARSTKGESLLIQAVTFDILELEALPLELPRTLYIRIADTELCRIQKEPNIYTSKGGD